MFPLNTVLFPYAHTRIHVFESRYKELVELCLYEDRPFGIVLIRAGDEVGGLADPYLVGTAVRIDKVDYLEEGRLDIQVHGERRFRIRELDDTKSYLVGKVEPVVELEVEPNEESAELIEQARLQFESLIHRLLDRQEFNVGIRFPEDPVVLSFLIANLLSMENLEKQRLLETTDTIERMANLIPILQTQNIQLSQPTHVRLSPLQLKRWIHPN